MEQMYHPLMMNEKSKIWRKKHTLYCKVVLPVNLNSLNFKFYQCFQCLLDILQDMKVYFVQKRHFRGMLSRGSLRTPACVISVSLFYSKWFLGRLKPKYFYLNSLSIDNYWIRIETGVPPYAQRNALAAASQNEESSSLVYLAGSWISAGTEHKFT